MTKHELRRTNFSLGDKVRITTELKSYTGTIIKIDPYQLIILTSGRTVHKDERNKQYESYSWIKSVELIKKTDGKLDLSAFDPHEYERRMNIKKIYAVGTEKILLKGKRRKAMSSITMHT